MRHSDDTVIKVLHALQDGYTVAQICRMFNVSRPTVERWRDNNGRRKQNTMGPPRRMSVGKKLIPEIARIMAANVGNQDKSTHRLTAVRVYELLKDPSSPVHDLDFSKRTVERVMSEVRPSFNTSVRMSYLQLNAEPASAQVDFGSVHLFNQGKETMMEILVLTLPYSNMRFAHLLPAQNFECFAEGLTRIFQAIGGVPRCIRFDNAKILVSQVIKGDDLSTVDPERASKLTISQDRDGKIRVLTPAYQQFKNYYSFLDEFCSPASGNEKGSVENAVGFYKRRLFSPPPFFDGDFDAFNKQLLAFAWEHGKERRPNTNKTCLEMFEREKSLFRQLPSEPYVPFVFKKVKPDKYGFVTFDKAKYQVRILPDTQHIFLKATWNRIEFYSCDLVDDLAFDYSINMTLTPEYTLLNAYPRNYSYKQSSFVDWLSIFEMVYRKPRSLRHTVLQTVWSQDIIDFLCSYQSSDRKILLSAIKSHLHNNKMEPVTQVLTDCLSKINFKKLPAEEVAALIRRQGEVAPDDMPELQMPDCLQPARDEISFDGYDFGSSPKDSQDDEM